MKLHPIPVIALVMLILAACTSALHADRHAGDRGCHR